MILKDCSICWSSFKQTLTILFINDLYQRLLNTRKPLLGKTQSFNHTRSHTHYHITSNWEIIMRSTQSHINRWSQTNSLITGLYMPREKQIINAGKCTQKNCQNVVGGMKGNDSRSLHLWLIRPKERGCCKHRANILHSWDITDVCRDSQNTHAHFSLKSFIWIPVCIQTQKE